MIFLRQLKHLLPRAKAWSLTIDKQLRQFFDGLTVLGSDFKDFDDDVYEDLFPKTTRELDAWEAQFALPSLGLVEQERRDRLDATWKAAGGQSPRYLQDTLQGVGFNVFIHEWWVPGTEPGVGVKQCVTPRDPNLFLTELNFDALCGMVFAECGDDFTECGGGEINGTGFPLVNPLFITTADIIPLAGESVAQAGESDVISGNFLNFTNALREYQIPDDPVKWPYFLYIGAASFPDLASVPANRRDEFETLCLKICPAQQWLGILVNFV